MSYDALQPDAYAEHLGEVNTAKDVIVAEDIHNAKGMLIAKKGQHVSHETVQKIIQFKLIKPLEESIDIADGLTPEKIMEDIRDLFKDENSRAVNERLQLGAEIRRGLKLFDRFAILRQKLTVLAMQMPNEYEKSLMVAWYGLLIAHKLNLLPAERDELFVAALMHDIGMLHIDRQVTSKSGQLTAEEWRAMQGHVAIGNAIMRQTVGMPPGAISAVLEHHEIADGTGYLSGRRGHELSVMGQLLGVADAMCAVLIKWKSQGRGARDLIPILRINSYIYHRGVCSAFIQVLRELNFREAGLVGDAEIDAFAGAVMRDHRSLCDYASRATELLNSIPRTSLERIAVKAAFVVHQHLSSIIDSSGMLDEGYGPWLRKVTSERQRKQYRDVEDMRLMLDELRWQLVKLTRLLRSVEQDPNAMSPEELRVFKEKLDSLPNLAN
jgi:HD-GYP domain-containing protein (c-di-GMP phosphodiesterase class II)